jgi:hypothetical protein
MLIGMTDQDFKHYLTKRVIPDLKDAGFDSAIESDEDHDVTLTIQRRKYY